MNKTELKLKERLEKLEEVKPDILAILEGRYMPEFLPLLVDFDMFYLYGTVCTSKMVADLVFAYCEERDIFCNAKLVFDTLKKNRSQMTKAENWTEKARIVYREMHPDLLWELPPF